MALVRPLDISPVRKRMRATSGRDNPREVAIRRLLYRARVRYRVHFPVPGRSRRTIDIAFTQIKLAVFLDGCFWHSCPSHGTRARSNADFWSRKLDQNKARDLDTNATLQNDGWSVLRIWEHEPIADAVTKILGAATRLRQRISP